MRARPPPALLLQRTLDTPLPGSPPWSPAVPGSASDRSPAPPLFFPVWAFPCPALRRRDSRTKPNLETTLPRGGDKSLGCFLADLGRLTPTLHRESGKACSPWLLFRGCWADGGGEEEVLLLTARLLGGRCKRTCGTWADAAPYIQLGHHGDGPGPFPVGPDPSVCPEKP